MKVKIEKIDHFGRGITYIDKKICFVEKALANEIVDVEIVKKTNKYLEAKVIRYIEESPLRIEEECPYSSVCGGCHLNHFCYNEENCFKIRKVKEVLSRYANVSSNIVEGIVSHDRNYYRNKITLHGKDGKLGLYQKGSHEVIPIQGCLLASPKINEMIALLQECNDDITEAIIKTSNDHSRVMISVTGKVHFTEKIIDMCDVFILNGIYQTKEHFLLTSIGSLKYYQGLYSFFQINNTLTKELYDEVKNNIIGRQYHTVLDLYCGIGTIGLYISDNVDKIIGIDYNVSNIEDANRNKELNHVFNIEFICDKVENQIDSFHDIDCIIVDPPRAGLDQKTREYLKKIDSKEIIYVSCDAVTLARDLKDLQEMYSIKKIKLFNMFPRTYHVECVSVLERKNVEK